jgi:hypothetical protein
MVFLFPRLMVRPLGLLALLTLLSPSTVAEAQSTVSADRLTDSVGVNIHLHYNGTIYRDNWDLVRARIVELGVRHVRDGLIDTTWQGYYDRHNLLGQSGIKGLFIVTPGMPTSVLQAYPSRMSSSFEGYEAPNEHNQSGDANWVSTMRATLQQLRSLRDTPGLAGYPVYGPSLTHETAYSALGDVSALIDVGNLHNYFGGFNPGTSGWGSNGYGSIDWNLALARSISGSKPIATTETGYWNDQTVGAVPHEVAGKYMPRLVLEQFRKGILRTYLYELADYVQTGTSQLTSSYGLLHGDGSPKPAFTAVKNLLNLLSDPGPAFPIRALQYSVSGGGTPLRHMAFQKRNGNYYLAIWLEQQGYDVNSKQLIAVPTQSVSVNFTGSVQLTQVHRWQPNGSVTRTAATGSTSPMSLVVGDTVTVLEFRSTDAPSPPTNLRLIH